MRFGRYEAVEKIGKGGFGVVWRARDPVLGRDVAVKVSRDPWLSDETMAEARALARLAHPAIVHVLDAGRSAEGAFVVMELVDGEDLDSALGGRGAVPAATAVALLEGVAAGVDHAHERGILHRDLKPGNLLAPRSTLDRLARRDTSGPLPVKVADFGLHALLRREDRGGESRQGDPGYVAPEAWRGQVDASSDVFALAAVFFRLVAGRTALPGVTPAERLAAVAGPERMRLCDLRPEIPAPLDEAMARALSPRRHERPSTARALLASFREALTKDEDRRKQVADAMERIEARRDPARSRSCTSCLRPLHPRADTCPYCGESVADRT